MTVEKASVHPEDTANVPSLHRLHDSDQTVSSSDEDIRGGWSRTRTAATSARSTTS